ncbi:hypothetical protein SAMN02745673_00435 [Marinactinospora thermotolerans DSM 45154]|uniref:Uncharacterized protein n=1 Tax=Marinactinospora thermotolerans DSM 45154 TaxID=1122192 RepID=A0A1T4KL69_9ACTN|nr:hypothetical protein [Marinactinospora thermotolerans]SJZ43117.1 hypothetical protein SAMN02745673_00435 [Marinactinospora thermotolerans DSM 45154]
MVDPSVLAGLAASGADVVVQAMATDAWIMVRDRIAGLFGAGREQVAGELEQARAEVVADDALAADAAAEWRSRLRRHLAAHPESVEELRAVLAEFAPGERGRVVNTITGDVYGTAIQAGTIHGGVRTTTYGGEHAERRGPRAGRDVSEGQAGHGGTERG